MSTESTPDIPWTAPLAPPSSDSAPASAAGIAAEIASGSAPASESAASETARQAPDLEFLGLKLNDLEEQARVMIREQPVVAVLAAAGLGYLVARLASRGKR